MSRTAVLSILLIAQFALIILITTFSGDKLATFKTDEKLLGLTLNDVSGIDIEDAQQKAAVSLVSENGEWLISSADNFPVSEAKIKKFLDEFINMEKSWPVATTEAAAKGFKVTDNDYNKKITFKNKDDVKAVLLLGTSPTFRAVNARIAGKDEIYSLALNAYDVTAKNDDWRDRDLLKVKQEDLEEIAVNNLLLKKNDMVPGGFALDVLNDNEVMSKDGVLSLVDKVTGLTFLNVLGKENKSEYQQDKPLLKFSLKVSGNNIDYLVSEQKNEAKDYVLKASTIPFYFQVAKPAIDALKEVNREKLVEAKPSETPTATPTVAPETATK